MTNKEIIKNIIEFNNPPRIGLDFNSPHHKDIAWISAAKLVNKKYFDHIAWGFYEEDLREAEGFKGEVRRDAYGNIFGRLEGKTNGECIKGALQDGWELLGKYELPEYDVSYEDKLKELFEENEGKFLLGALPVSVFFNYERFKKN